MPSWIDISVPVDNRLPVWPGDHRVELTVESPTKDFGNSVISTSLHVGTHMDAPAHVIPGGTTIDQVQPDRLIGKTFVAGIPAAVTKIDQKVLESLNIPASVTRLLFKTSNSGLWQNDSEDFDITYAALTLDGAAWVVERGIKLVGIDYLSIQLYENEGTETHYKLLSNDVLVVEGLNLGEVAPGWYDLICLPWKVAGACGAPVRAVLKRKS